MTRVAIKVVATNAGLAYELIPAYGRPGHLEVVPF